ncbi:FG-GAP-like repeat-containing protein [Desulfofustis glycolicus]|uniref:Repeat domain-containing protein n=1 Tax=Desulfofustis glycolicus DSM 9705 TaxID=1121409 RepID=A0A1M5VPV0_9BACT|nr:FG-GAP-like repeat-containing protein [Desulfofustis glycolicus]SHH77311.1 Repeat domain-containing protein [Desulfofustis glycolicus DSM 9705]
MNKHIILTIALISLVLGTLTAQAETLSVTNATGTPGQRVTVNIILDDNDNGVAGTTFTLNYDAANLDLVEVRSEFFPLFSTQNITPTSIEIDGTIYDSALVICPAGSKFAAARVDNGPLGHQTIFELDFVIDETAPTGTSLPVQIQQTQVQNSEAGYEELTPIPYLIGIDGTAYPERTLSAPATAGSISVEEGTSFVDTDGDGIDDNWEIEYFGNTNTATVATDTDGDGYSDLVEYENETDPNVRNASGNDGYNKLSDKQAAVNRDFNGDGRDDILWRHSTLGRGAIWFMNGTTKTIAYPFTESNLNWVIKETGDFNGDGNDDILWRNIATGGLYIYLMDGATRVEGSGSLGAVDLAWDIQATGDFNGDGRDDILWRHSTLGRGAIWFMNGTTKTIAYPFTESNLNWVIKETGDFNGDGNDDILWRNIATGGLYIYLMDGATRVEGSGSLGAVDLAWDIQATGDFNGDGRDDILWRHSTLGRGAIWFMNGTTKTIAYPFTESNLDWVIRKTGDFNGDGKDDILWRNITTGGLYIYLMDGATRIEGSGSLGAVDLAWDIQ